MAELPGILFRGLARLCAWLLLLSFVEILLFSIAAIAGTDILPEDCAPANIIAGVECSGFPAAKSLGFALSVPMLLFFIIPFALVNIRTLPLGAALFVLPAVAVWGLGLLHWFRLRKSRTHPAR